MLLLSFAERHGSGAAVSRHAYLSFVVAAVVETESHRFFAANCMSYNVFPAGAETLVRECSVFDHPVELEKPARLTGNELVLELPCTPGGPGVGVGAIVNGKSMQKHTCAHRELVMSHVPF